MRFGLLFLLTEEGTGKNGGTRESFKKVIEGEEIYTDKIKFLTKKNKILNSFLQSLCHR